VKIGRRIGILLGALFVAVFLWSYVHLAQAYETDVDLPISVVTPHGLAVSDGLPGRLHARIKGAGWQLIMMSFTHNSFFQLDLSERDTKNLIAMPLAVHADDLAHNVVLPSEVRLVKVEPDSLMLSFAGVTQKRVPIRPVFDVTTSSGFAVIGPAHTTPATVLVQGTHRVLDSLLYFPTKVLVVRNAREDVTKTVELSDTLANMVTVVNPQPVQIAVNVEAVAEQVFHSVPIHIDALPPDKDVLLIPSDLSVTLRGGVDQLSSLNVSGIHVHVKYDAVAFDTSRTIVPSVDVPEGTTFVDASPDRLRFVLRTRTEVDHAHR